MLLANIQTKFVVAFVGNGHPVFDFKTLADFDELYPPIGMEIDTNGNLYAGRYSGSIYVIDPR